MARRRPDESCPKEGNPVTSPAPSEGHPDDRLAIRGLIDAWAHHADRRLPEQQAALFTKDGRVSVYLGDPETTRPTQVVRGPADLADSFDELSTYDVTTHLNGQSTIEIEGNRATGETYCLAHHLWVEGGQRMLMVMSIRYHDVFVRQDDQWLFADRRLIVDWVDQRPSAP
jgi:SnoaL-like domain